MSRSSWGNLKCKMGKHDLRPIGGIPFLDKTGIMPDGTQELWCLDCKHKESRWPWEPDVAFKTNETFGYAPNMAGPQPPRVRIEGAQVIPGGHGGR